MKKITKLFFRHFEKAEFFTEDNNAEKNRRQQEKNKTKYVN